jgi:site-specific recombinase XerD
MAVRLHGKGRKERAVPLWKSTASMLRAWLEAAEVSPDAPVFRNRSGRAISRSGVEHRLHLAVARASRKCPSLAGRTVSPHTIRHTTAMHLLEGGVDLSTVALWLGHESPATTHRYVDANLSMKEAALQRVADPSPRTARYRATDRLLAFLERL